MDKSLKYIYTDDEKFYSLCIFFPNHMTQNRYLLLFLVPWPWPADGDVQHEVAEPIDAPLAPEARVFLRKAWVPQHNVALSWRSCLERLSRSALAAPHQVVLRKFHVHLLRLLYRHWSLSGTAQDILAHHVVPQLVEHGGGHPVSSRVSSLLASLLRHQAQREGDALLKRDAPLQVTAEWWSRRLLEWGNGRCRWLTRQLVDERREETEGRHCNLTRAADFSRKSATRTSCTARTVIQVFLVLVCWWRRCRPWLTMVRQRYWKWGYFYGWLRLTLG